MIRINESNKLCSACEWEGVRESLAVREKERQKKSYDDNQIVYEVCVFVCKYGAIIP